MLGGHRGHSRPQQRCGLARLLGRCHALLHRPVELGYCRRDVGQIRASPPRSLPFLNLCRGHLGRLGGGGGTCRVTPLLLSRTPPLCHPQINLSLLLCALCLCLLVRENKYVLKLAGQRGGECAGGGGRRTGGGSGDECRRGGGSAG
eukprot:1512884-Prymnesium_polylepis.2